MITLPEKFYCTVSKKIVDTSEFLNSEFIDVGLYKSNFDQLINDETLKWLYEVDEVVIKEEPKTSWFTFGIDHKHTYKGQELGFGTVLEVTSKDPRKFMFDNFGEKWAFEYNEYPLTLSNNFTSLVKIKE